MEEAHIATLIAKYIKDTDVVSIGTNELGLKFIKLLALEAEKKEMKIKFVPTSIRATELAHIFGLEITTLDDNEIDVGIEFVSQVDENFNFIKVDSQSLIRDKMIAQSAANLIVVCERKNFVKKLKGKIPFEVATFGYKRTLHALEAFGKASIRVDKKGIPLKTESGQYIIDVDIDEIYSLEELESNSKNIPGVIETGLFIGYADTIILYDDKNVEVKSRLDMKQIYIK